MLWFHALISPESKTVPKGLNMFSADCCRVMARYNHLQNINLLTAASTLSDGDRRADRGAFFGSVVATLNHLYWADALQLARLKGDPRPEAHITHSLDDPSDWSSYVALRARRDAEILEWAERLTDKDLQGDLEWFPGDGLQRHTLPKALCALQMFNHQTHHRGQVHAMLTAAGARPGPTGLDPSG